jgi:hypothetical protein
MTQNITKEQILENTIEKMPFPIAAANIQPINKAMEFYKEQELSKEREKTKKLVELLEECLEYHLDINGDKYIIERINQTLNEIAEQPNTNEREWPCSDETCNGEMKAKGFTQPNGTTHYECTKCGKTESYP